MANQLITATLAYLDGEAGIAELLNDLLEEHGRERVAMETDEIGRLEIVLEKMLSREQGRDLAFDFAEHVIPVAPGTGT